MKNLLPYLKDYKKECILAPAFKMFEALLELFVPLVVASMIDKGIIYFRKGYVAGMSALLILIALVGLAVSVTAQYFAAKAAVGFSAKLRKSLFSHLLDFSYTQIDNMGPSTMITRMTGDITQAQNGVNMVLRLLLRSPFVVLGAMIMAFTIDVWSAMLFAAVICALTAVIFLIMNFHIPMMKKIQKQVDQLTTAVRENLTGVRVIRAFVKEKEEAARFDQRNNLLLAQQERTGRISGLLNPLTYVLINLAIIFLIRTGAIQVSYGRLTQGQVVALYNYMSQILVELIKLANLTVTINKALASAGRISEALAIPADYGLHNDILRGDNDKDESLHNISKENGNETDNGLYNATKETVGAIGTDLHNVQITDGDANANDLHNSINDYENAENNEFIASVDLHNTDKEYSDRYKIGIHNTDEHIADIHTTDCAVEFDRVSLTYDGAGDESLSDISFSAGRGQIIGIIGGTGSGKTSLVNLIPGFYKATKGSVRLFGKDVNSYTKQQIGELVSVVPQKAVLFKGTIADNLRWGKEDALDEEMLWAAGIAQALDVIEAKGGLQGDVEQGGRNFSGGQRQRLTIARAVVGKKPVLILDDSSSALDMATDRKLREALRTLTDTTVFIVSQRTNAIMDADLILVLENGKLIGKGTHEELLENCGVYCEIHDSQIVHR